ncbi:hypothetical protein F4818DRAFT_455525 [Hypoxylon cercidicola]|nr:hypothetical protein F4818DRAFT_455525 [Hypoxylon cercidicola]
MDSLKRSDHYITYTPEFLASDPSELPYRNYDDQYYPPTRKTAEEKARIAAEYYQKNGISLARLWLEANSAIDNYRPEESHQEYLRQICNLACEMIPTERKMQRADANELARASLHLCSLLGITTRDVGVQTVETKPSKFNPEAAIFTPMVTPTKAALPTKAKAVTSRTQSFEERCQKLGLRFVSPPPTTPVAIFQERCKKNGLRVSSPKN